jgi:hypothetical protein
VVAAGPGEQRVVGDEVGDPPALDVDYLVDQAEELLTRTPEPARRRFATLLLEATGGPVRAVATSRSEFLDPAPEDAAR